MLIFFAEAPHNVSDKKNKQINFSTSSKCLDSASDWLSFHNISSNYGSNLS